MLLRPSHPHTAAMTPHAQRSIPMLPGKIVRMVPATTIAEEDKLLKELPAELTESMYYLSRLQLRKVLEIPELAGYADDLPGWVPHRVVAMALGHGVDAIEVATASLGRPYVWATEFENVHDCWHYIERPLQIGGRWYKDSEAYYHSQKPEPFDAREWEGRRLNVMVTAVEAKLKASDDVYALLLSTRDHPLLSIKPDEVWGWHPQYYAGGNWLAKIHEEYRKELQRRVADELPPWP